MGDHPEVMFISSSVGAGHHQAARAVIEVLRRRHPEIETEFVDALERVPRWFRLWYNGAYTLGVTQLHRLYGWFYDRLDRPTGPRRRRGERVRLATERYATRRLRRYILSRRPKLVVATHFLAPPSLGRMIGKGRADLGLWIIMTDQEAHRFWYTEHAGRYFVANEQIPASLARWGIDPGRVMVTGIPVHPKWTDPLDAGRVLEKWGLPGDRPIVLLSGGAYFTVGPVTQIARGILDRTDAHVVVLAGNNKKLLADLAEMPESGQRLTGIGWTDKVHELAHVAALMVTKPGGLITSELITKGLPMVLTKPVPGQEAANAELLSSEGAAILTRGDAEVVDAVSGLLANPEGLEALRSNARRFYRPAAETIADEIAAAVGEAQSAAAGLGR
jgi:processive 1,2-diacylglycerol beta-glucosyltransferase